MSELVEHIDLIEKRVTAVGDRRAFAFGLACLQRMLPAYENAGSNSGWFQPSVLENALKAAWGWVIAGGNLPPDLAHETSRAIPAFDELVTTGATAAFTVANAVSDFMVALTTGRAKFAYLPAARAIDVLEVVEGDLPPDSELVRPLLQAELTRQLRDLAALELPESAEQLLSVRDTSRAENLLGDVSLRGG